MNNLKTNPVGIDLKIDSFQKRIYDFFSGFNVEGFPRVYKVIKNDKVLPCHYISNNDYKEVLLDDSKDATFFFDTDNEDNIKGSLFSSSVNIIFLLNVNNLKPNASHREDEEIKLEIYNVIDGFLNREEIKITKGDEALNGYDTDLKSAQPYYFIKYSFDLKYTI